MRLTEIWQKGHPTRNQVLRLVSNALGNSADVKLDRDVIEIEMYWHAFIDKFTYPGMSDKLLTMNAKLEKIRDMQLNSGSPEGYRKYDTEYKELKTKVYRYFQKVKSDAIHKARSFVPQGWVLTGNFDINYAGAANDKLELKIIRDYNLVAENTQTYFHVTNKKNLEFIKQNGLVPGSNSRSRFHGYRNRVYLFKYNPINLDAETILHIITGKEIFADEAAWATEIVIFKVEMPEDATLYVDPEFESAAVYSEDPIPVSNLEIIYQGPISKMV